MTTNVFDANGNLTATIDKLSQRWPKTYDRLNRVIAEADPLGDTKTTTYDSVGRVKQITTPRGYPSTHFYDGRGRLTKWVDAENYEWKYDYDGVGNITNITDALNGHYVMAYGPRNERTLERNQDNFEWRYTYDELLRLKIQRDPNGTVRTLSYDAGGRVLEVGFSTGRVNGFNYDENNNPGMITRSDPGKPATVTVLDYDVMDRATQCRDAFNKTVNYTYDLVGRVAALQYPDGKILTNRYDVLSQLTNQVFNSQQGMSYTYDKAGRLLTRVYPNGIVQTNTFDNAGQITCLTYSTNTANPANSVLIALTYAYDKNGNKAASTEKGTLDWPRPSLRDESTRYTPSGRLIDRQISTNSSLQSSISYTYDPSGNMTNATGGGQSWALTYDEDNRVTSVMWEGGITSKINANRYDALGRRISRTKDGTETRYVLDLSGSMERILCDTTSSGQITAWYVQGPDLCYRLDSTNGLICYHADAQGNIISLTDATTNTVAQYAYTPYGRSLPSTNSQPLILAAQPYTFVGSQGVMEDLPGLYFMRARYYSADAGVLLSTDPVKKIGPNWRPAVYEYAGGNPNTYIDPEGELFVFGGFDPISPPWRPGLIKPSVPGSSTLFNGPKWVPDPDGMGGGWWDFGIFGRERVEPCNPVVVSVPGEQTARLQSSRPSSGSGDLSLRSATSQDRAQVFLSAETTTIGQSLSPAVGHNYPTLQSLLRQEGSQLAQSTPKAGQHAESVNSSQARSYGSSASQSGTTTVTASSSTTKSGGGTFAKVSQSVSNTAKQASNTITQSVKNVTSTVKQSVSKAVSAVKNVVSKLFGGGKK